jgi:hypothetical protein
VSRDTTITPEVELLTATVGDHVRRNDQVDAGDLAMMPDGAHEAGARQREWNDVVMPERVAKEVERVEWRPSPVLGKPL